MELQTGDHPGWDRPPVTFTKTGVVSQFATFTTTGAGSQIPQDPAEFNMHALPTA